jgi:hypothetical protein
MTNKVSVSGFPLSVLAGSRRRLPRHRQNETV